MSVCKLAVWTCLWMVSTVALCLRKCRTNLARLLSRTNRAPSLTSRTVMATASEGAGDVSLIEKIAKNVVQNVRSKEVRVH